MNNTANSYEESIFQKLLDDSKISKLSKDIASEFQNLNTFSSRSFPQYLAPEVDNNLSLNCRNIFQIVKEKISNEVFRQNILDEEECKWIRHTTCFGIKDGDYDNDAIAMHICIAIIQKKFRQLDYYIQNLEDTSIIKKLNLKVNKHHLVDLSDTRLTIRNHGIIFNKEILIYPHQFLRRYYSSNFVGMPAMLRTAKDKGCQVYVRLDPFRETTSNRYQEIMEFDHWYGPPFSNKLLLDHHINTRTLHKSSAYYSLSYEVDTTIFRTKMMDESIREFMIEEYSPLNLPYGGKSPGIGDEFCIQKFAHICYDQKNNCFIHIDGAVRVFERNEYEGHFQQVKSGLDVDEKIGERHKLFLVEGKIDKELAEQLITEWFRYNPHIQEYFSGTSIKPLITHEEYEKRIAERIN